MISRRTVLVSGLALAATSIVNADAASASVTTIKSEDGRDVRVWIWPAAGRQKGVILFSHGALSAPEKYPHLLAPWIAAGFKVLAPLHVDSTDYPDKVRYGMNDSWRTRLLDMRALAAFAGEKHFVAAGHSYGALVALVLGGATPVIPPGLEAPLRMPRADCVIAFSPPGPLPGLITAEGYATLAVPAIIETGTADVPFGAKDGRWQVHLTAYEVAPAGDKYALVLDGADHYFGNLICSPERDVAPQTDALNQALVLSTDFLKAFGAHDRHARRRLDRALGKTGLATLSRK